MRGMESGKRSILSVIDEYFGTYGDLVDIKLGPVRIFLTRNPEHIRHCLQENHMNFGRSISYKFLAYFLGQGLLTSEGDLWRKQRRLAQPAFHRQKIAGFGSIISRAGDELIKSWENKTNCSLSEEMSHVALAIVSRALFGTDLHDESEAIGRALAIALDEVNRRSISLLNPPMFLPTKRNRAYRASVSEMDRIAYNIIENREMKQAQQASAGTESSPEDLLGMFLAARDAESGEAMSRKQIRDELITMIMAGHETTANALCWTIYLLMKHPEIDSRLRAEIQTIGSDVSLEDLARVPYLQMVIEESMRLFPPVPGLERLALGDAELGGVKIPKGSIVNLVTFAAHRHPGFWDNAESFKPERFATANASMRRDQYFPFGGGPRMCIGNHFAMLEAQILLVKILRAYRFEFAGEEPLPQIQVTLRPHNGMPVKLVRI